MRHRMRGRKLGRDPAHRKAMVRNMACSLIRSVRVDEDDKKTPKVPGRIVTTLPKAKQLRPFVEKLVTMARKAVAHEREADQYAITADRNSSEWKNWRDSDEWNRWAEARAPAVALRRRAFSQLRDPEAVDILFDELAERFEDRPGGYTRVVRLPSRRLGDAGQHAVIEFVGQRDRVPRKRAAPTVREDEEALPEETPPESDEPETGRQASATSEADADDDSAAPETEQEQRP